MNSSDESHESEALRAARVMRRAMLGDAYVDSVTADPDPVAAEFQDYVTTMAWGVWARGGPLSTRDRSLLVMAMTAALGRMDEFRLHVGAAPQTGVTDEEIDELLFQIAAYCGAPAAIAARRNLLAVRAARTEAPPAVTDGTFGAEVGMVGLGNMGSALAANLVKAGHTVLAYDLAGPERTPGGALASSGIAELAARASVIVLSLPDGPAVEQVVQQLLKTAGRRTTHVIDTSTVGVSAARALAALLAADGISYIEAPVSGGVSGARARTLTVMCAGPQDAIDAAAPVLSALSDRVLRIPGPPGSAQALKLANNFLSATALAATSEAIAFGLTAGLDMKTMLDVLNTSSGRSAATMDKFPEHVLTERYASGFANSLMAKDLRLYLAAVAEAGAPARLGALTTDVWERFAESVPGADFTCIFPFVAGG